MFTVPYSVIFHFLFRASSTLLLYRSTVTFLISFVFRYFFFCVQNTYPWFFDPWYLNGSCPDSLKNHYLIFRWSVPRFLQIWTGPPFRWSMFMSFLYCNFIIIKQSTFVNTFLKIILNIFKNRCLHVDCLVFFVEFWNILSIYVWISW